MTKNEREELRNKYGGKCAYCGCQLGKVFHADHIEPILRGWKEGECERYKKPRGSNCIENLNPCCPRCNRWKGTFTVEQFRNEIAQQVSRARRASANFRMAEDYGLIKHSTNEVIFHFEKTTLNPAAGRIK